jgi:hypothetical protein
LKPSSLNYKTAILLFKSPYFIQIFKLRLKRHSK